MATTISRRSGSFFRHYQTSSAYLKNSIPLVENGEAIPLFSFGALGENGELIRDVSFANTAVGVFDGDTVRVNVPHFGELYQALGYEAKGIEWDIWFAFMSAGFGGMKLLLIINSPIDFILDSGTTLPS